MAFAASKSDAEHLRAISAYLNSSIGRYLTFFHCVHWGVERTDFAPSEARTVPIPDFTPEQVAQLAQFYRQLSDRQTAELASKQIPLFKGQSEKMRPARATPEQEQEIRRLLDDEVERVLGIPPHLAIIPREFMEVRFQFLDGKSSVPAAMQVENDALARYAQCLARLLDDFARTSHRISISHDRDFIVCTIEITDKKEPIEPTVFKGEPSKEDQQLWQDLRQPFSQWVYVQRSLCVFEGRKIHLWKNARVMDWTQTQAMLDADSIISDVLTYTGETS